MSAELASLRAYVTDPTGRAGLAQASSTVLLNVEHASLKANFVELRLDRHVRFFCVSSQCPHRTGKRSRDSDARPPLPHTGPPLPGPSLAQDRRARRDQAPGGLPPACESERFLFSMLSLPLMRSTSPPSSPPSPRSS